MVSKISLWPILFAANKIEYFPSCWFSVMEVVTIVFSVKIVWYYIRLSVISLVPNLFITLPHTAEI